MMLSRAARLLAALLTIGVPAHAQTPKPLILVVHGRGLLGFDSAQVRRDAWHALQTSTRSIDPAFTLDERDVRLVWYADILDAHSNGAAAPSCPASQISDSVRERESVPSALSVIAMLAGPLFEAASTDAKSEDAIGLRGLAGDLRYLADLDTRCAAERRVADAMRAAHRDRRPVILVSHSLGALVTWGELTHAASVRDTTIGDVQRWITLGSPLGSAEIRQLIFGDDHATLAKPAMVHSWVNVLGGDDPFAVRIAGVPGDSLSDVKTALVHEEPHNILSYLFDKSTGGAVLDAWRSATIRR